MNKEVEKLCAFSEKYFDLNVTDLYGKSRKEKCVIARNIIWHEMHYRYNISVSNIAKEFFKTKRNVFYGISKIKNAIKKQRFYRDLYNKFIEEYNKKATL